MLSTQPLTKPMPGVDIHRPVGFADRSQAEVVGPPRQHAIELLYSILDLQQRPSTTRLFADRAAQPRDPFLRRAPTPLNRRVGFRITLFEACSAFTQVTACMLAASFNGDPVHQRLRRFRCLHRLSNCHRPERPLAGRD